MNTSEAMDLAQREGLDLVEVAPDSNPPVCRIIDYGKYRYKQSKRAKEAKKRQHVTHIKELKVRPKIEDHDFRFKVKHVTAEVKVVCDIVSCTDDKAAQRALQEEPPNLARVDGLVKDFGRDDAFGEVVTSLEAHSFCHHKFAAAPKEF